MLDREKTLEIAQNIVKELVDLEVNLESVPVDGLGEVHVLVPARYADEARALIEEQ